MADKINTVLLLFILLLLIYPLRQKPTEVGRFQQIQPIPGMPTTNMQVAFDTKTGQRCWVWLEDASENRGNFSLCSDLAKR